MQSSEWQVAGMEFVASGRWDDGHSSSSARQHSHSRWKLLRNPCCLARPELCEAEKRPNPIRLASAALGSSATGKAASTGHAMAGGRAGGQNSSARQKIACPAVQSIVTWRGARCLQSTELRFQTTHHLAGTCIPRRRNTPTPTTSHQRTPSPPSSIPRSFQYGNRTCRRRGRKCYL